MQLRALDERELSVAGECLRAAADGPFFPDWEFVILFGVDREAVRAVAERWPEIGDDTTAEAALLNSLNNLSGYPIDHESDWSTWVSMPRESLPALIGKLRGDA